MASYMLVRANYLRWHRYRQIEQDCIDSESKREMIMLKCLDNCQDDCSFKYYPFQLNNVGKYETRKTKIILEHNELPDILVEQNPEMNFTTFVCNFGGLLGMLLGLSFLSIIKHILLITRNIAMHKLSNIKKRSIKQELSIIKTYNCNNRKLCNRRNYNYNLSRNYTNMNILKYYSNNLY